MSLLKIYSDKAGRPVYATDDVADIRRSLAGIGALFQRVRLPSTDLDRDANQDEVIEAYRETLDDLMQEHGFAAMDVLTVAGAHPHLSSLHREFMEEHWHRGVEGRLFVAGRGLYYLRARDRIYAVLCGRGDFIGLPAGTSHWFDMGERPSFRAIRLFPSAEGWDAVATGRNMSGQFPSLDRFAQDAAAAEHPRRWSESSTRV